MAQLVLMSIELILNPLGTIVFGASSDGADELESGPPVP